MKKKKPSKKKKKKFYCKCGVEVPEEKKIFGCDTCFDIMIRAEARHLKQ